MNKTIIIITPGFPPDENDSTTIPYLQDYILALKEKIGAAQIKIMTIHFPFTKKIYYWNGIEVIPLNGRNKRGFTRFFTHVNGAGKLKKIFAKYDCIMHSFWLTDAALLADIRRKHSGVKHIATMMGQDVKSSNRTLPFIDFGHTTTVALSQNQANIFEQSTGRMPDHIIQFGIKKVEESVIHETREFDILFAGSMIGLKQPSVWVDIISNLKADFPNIKAVMIGDGPLKQYLIKKIKSIGLEENISVMGAMTRDEVFNYMRRSKILLHTSEFEGQCVVFTEALAYGMYVVSFNVGHIEKTEKQIVCETQEEMQIRLYKLLSSEMNYNSCQPFTSDDTASKYLGVYSTL